MRLRHLRLQNFRNVSLASLELRGDRQFFLGANGQGKTNLLEGAGYLTALRSFRSSDSRVLISHGHNEAAMAFEITHEKLGETRVTIRLHHGSKEVVVDNARVTRLADYLGQFPTVVFSSQDQQLIRGAPASRRRWMDLTLASVSADYLRSLQHYHRAVAGRNALLKRAAGASELAAFERPMAAHGANLIAVRQDGLRALSEDVLESYAEIADSSGSAVEKAGFVYLPNIPADNEDTLLAKIVSGRARDLQFRASLTGPHRDDFDFQIDGRSARDVASEGQQRALVLALKVAQAGWFRRHTGLAPVILADDVLGELDPDRRRRFWNTLDRSWQVLATGTSFPSLEAESWQCFAVAEGGFTPVSAPVP